MDTTTLAVPPVAQAKSVSPTWRRFRDAFRRHPTALIGGAILIGMVGMAIFAPWLGTIDPQAVSPIKRLRAPSAAFWFGTDMLGRDVYSRVVYGARVSLVVGLAVAMLSILVAVPLGVVAAAKAGTWLDRAVMSFSVLGFSVPVFVFAYILILTFSVQLDWLPVQGYRNFRDGVWEWLRHLILPSVALGTVYVALIARMTRASMLDVLAQDYIRTASAKGLAPGQVLIGHALKNAAIPVITIIGMGVALLISGAIVTETVFALPGIGRLTVDAILRRDYPIIQGVILIFSAVYVLVNLFVDLSYVFFDPRIRY